jgi:O-antigen/teichoic acid export membrane protein
MRASLFQGRFISKLKERCGSANHAFVLGGGYALGQGAILVSTPWISRQFNANDFGLLANLLTVSNIAMNLGALRLDQAILVSDSERDALHLRNAALCLAVAWGIVLTIIVWLAGTSISFHPDAAWLIGGTVLLATATQVACVEMVRRGRILGASAVRASQGVLFVALAMGSGLGLGVSFVLSWSAGAWALVRWTESRSHLASMLATVKRYSQFPLIGSLGTLVDVVGFSIVVWVISGMFGLAESGRVTQAQRVVGAPLMVLAIALGPVLQKRWAEGLLRGDTSVEASFRRVLWALASLAVVWVLLIALAGPWLGRLVLGAGWIEDRWMLIALAVAVCARGVVSPLSGLIVARRELGRGLTWQLAYFLVAVTVLPLAARLLDLRSFVLAYSAMEAGMYFVYLLMIRKLLR